MVPGPLDSHLPLYLERVASSWPLWDRGVESVTLEGPFAVATLRSLLAKSDVDQSQNQ
ncbi:MAG: hypothetical protein ABIZ50_02630 [Solirubrobacterales bacterium]